MGRTPVRRAAAQRIHGCDRPVLLIGLAGYFLGRARAVDARTLSSLAANILARALMFSALSTSTLVVVTTLLSPLTIAPLLVLLR